MVMTQCDVYADFQSVVVRKESAHEVQCASVVGFLPKVWDFLHECMAWTDFELEFVGVNFTEMKLYIQYVDESAQSVSVPYFSKEGISSAMLLFVADLFSQIGSRY